MSPAWFCTSTRASNKDLNTLVKHYVTRGVEVPEGADDKMYFPGKFLMATSEMDTTIGISGGGKLFVIYDVELSAPQLDNPVGLEASVGSPNYSSSTIDTFPLGDDSTPTIFGTANMAIISQVQGDGAAISPEVQFQLDNPGTYLVLLGANLGTTGSNPGFINFGDGGTTGNEFTFLTQSLNDASASNDTGRQFGAWLLYLADPSAVLYFNVQTFDPCNFSIVLVSFDSNTNNPTPGVNPVLDSDMLDKMLSLLSLSTPPKLKGEVDKLRLERQTSKARTKRRRWRGLRRHYPKKRSSIIRSGL